MLVAMCQQLLLKMLICNIRARLRAKIRTYFYFSNETLLSGTLLSKVTKEKVQGGPKTGLF